MSAQATAAVLRHAEGNDAEWRLLMLLADAADRRGVVSGVSSAELAEAMGGRTERNVTQIKNKVIGSGQLVVIEKGGGRGRRSVYWIRLPGLLGPDDEETRTGEQGKLLDTPNDVSGKDQQRSNKGEKKTSTSSTAREDSVREFVKALTDLTVEMEVPLRMQRDAAALLREGRKVGRRLVSGEEMAKAAACLATFNRVYEWNGREGAAFELGSNLTSIVLRIRDVPSWDAAKHVRLVESAWRIRWWEKQNARRRPTPNVIWGEKAFNQVAQDAKEESESGRSAVRRKYTRENRG